MNEAKKERERIVGLINCWREFQDMGTSLQAGRLIDAINGQDEVYRDKLENGRPVRIRADYELENMSRIDDLHNDVWGSEGPDCRTMPALVLATW